jgi:hypothetical protein
MQFEHSRSLGAIEEKAKEFSDDDDKGSQKKSRTAAEGRSGGVSNVTEGVEVAEPEASGVPRPPAASVATSIATGPRVPSSSSSSSSRSSSAAMAAPLLASTPASLAQQREVRHPAYACAYVHVHVCICLYAYVWLVRIGVCVSFPHVPCNRIPGSRGIHAAR